MIITIGTSEDFQEGKGKGVIIEGVRCAVYRLQGILGCITDACVHSGGPLCEGFITNGKVTCPLHKWEFNHVTGKGFGKESQGGYHIWEESGIVYVDTDIEHPRVEYPCF